MTNRVIPSLCSLSVRFHTAGARRLKPARSAASCHSYSVGSRGDAKEERVGSLGLIAALATECLKLGDTHLPSRNPDGRGNCDPCYLSTDIVKPGRQRFPLLHVRCPIKKTGLAATVGHRDVANTRVNEHRRACTR